MKKITILLVLIFTFLFSTTSWGEWTYVAGNYLGHKMYYDKDKIKKNEEYIHFWELYDLSKPIMGGILSTKSYVKLDCSILRYKFLSYHSYKKSMGEGVGVDENASDKWRIPTPNNMGETFYKKLCEEHQSSPVTGDNHKGETLYAWGEYLPFVWKGFGDKETHPKYQGQVKDGKPNGLGILIYPDGMEYVGGWKNGVMNGQGTFTNPNGEKYVGEWIDGRPNGQGTVTLPDGDKYVGEFKDGEKHGHGTHTYSDGYKYEGGWKNGKRHGKGTYRHYDGYKFVGEYKDDKRNGQGTLTSSKGDKFVGEYKDGKKNGQGTYTWSNGEKYVGEYKDGEPNGQGTATFSDGGMYVGSWQNGKMNGQGAYTWSDGIKYVGKYNYGLEWNGKGYDKYGNILVKFVNGEPLEP